MALQVPSGAEPSAQPPHEADTIVVHLHAGQVFASAEPCTISTVLGSCVAVCLWDPERRAGGANHYLLPLHIVGGRGTARFGNVAIDELVSRMAALGCRTRDLRAKVFGGGRMVTAARQDGGSLGMENVEVARRSLVAYGIPIVAEDVGGERGRKLLFSTLEGHAWVRKL